ncbi:MAG: L-rhamnose isomerase [Methylacidiphilales bacterium]|nr:L-rhamnose isomerase [Candidatus Methylacidiphilales bacterium]
MNDNHYASAKEQYAALGVDTEAALETMARVPVSLQCWQGDDVGGFEKDAGPLTGGIQATGNYPGKARTPKELRRDLETALSLIPGRHRVNLHACYAELEGKKIERNAYTAGQFTAWVDWAKERGLGLDFNPTYFSHPLSADGFTLSHRDEGVRRFWIEHGIACRRIAADIGRRLSQTVITNFWIPDGSKDATVSRRRHREWLVQSLDAVFAEKIDPAFNRDAVESKLFGIGFESYTVGSHEFYLGYAASRQKIICLDAGHFHPTETIADKISSVLLFVPEVLLHVSRGVRWDSDHVVVLDDATRALMEEIVRGDYLGRVHIGMDYFDASINRIAAWIIGARSTQKALLLALLEPRERLRQFEDAGDFSSRLALFEEAKGLPAGEVWNEFCRRLDVPAGFSWMETVKKYERDVLSLRK